MKASSSTHLKKSACLRLGPAVSILKNPIKLQAKIQQKPFKSKSNSHSLLNPASHEDDGIAVERVTIPFNFGNKPHHQKTTLCLSQ